ncbi:cyclic nucleotide-gated ion channel 2 isoform X2 [Nymphaea colorata]|uniref:cyclic nucleotide-gated ion channel 2 isoform X2 n=1 Tax=Nymphaea colorata TaxID=210225 RepID=UPI00129E8DBF|nr:cyclic nucleotide-gated ion channel 2 isoform X2 [Nymphaea colorata]
MPFISEIQHFLSRRCLLFGKERLKCSGVGEDAGDISISSCSSMATGECYACTQQGTPAFHSVSCLHSSHSLLWEANAGSSLAPVHRPEATVITTSDEPRHDPPSDRSPRRAGWARLLGRPLDPRSRAVQRRNRTLLLLRATAVALDPLFFYAISVGRGHAGCLYLDGGLAAVVTALRTCADATHVASHMWMQLRLAYVSKESMVVGCGKLVWDPRAIASHYLRSARGFWLDLFVVLPLPQIVMWLVVPKLIREGEMKSTMTILLLTFLFQFLPKVYHSVVLMRRMQKVTGYVFGTIWWGFGLNLIAYFIASHVAGGCWYILAIQRVASCLHQECQQNNTCHVRPLACSKDICYKLTDTLTLLEFPCFDNQTVAVRKLPACLDPSGPFRYGIYRTALPVITSGSLAVKILYPIFWGLMALSTFGNDLEPTSQWLEVIFSITIVLSGLLLFTLLIGNIQVFLQSVMARKRMMQLRSRDMEWWMRRRQLPSKLRQRVRHYEHQRWATMRGEDEMELIKDLPQGLRRDIKRHLCLDLMKQVPLFFNLDDLILDNICDRIKPLVFSKDEKIIREGDPVQRMVFIVQGHLESVQSLSKGMLGTCKLGPGNFLGDELLSWCLRRPFVERLPPSSATFISLEPTEAFGLDAADLKYITEHFRYKFANERLKRTARYYSSTWRTWAAVNIQLAWRRYQLSSPQLIQVVENVDNERRLRHYAAIFLSLRPHDHLE